MKVGAVIILVAIVVAFASPQQATAVIPPWEIEGLKNKPAPEFSAKDVAGNNHILKEYRGRVVLINFWATWCSPCRREMPSLIKLYHKYNNQGLVLLAVSVDEQRRAVENFTRKLPLPFPVISDPEEKISSHYKVFAYPTSFLIDRNGIIRKIITGERDWLAPEFTARLEKMMGVD